jgi:AcrR family transcriptional regulator
MLIVEVYIPKIVRYIKEEFVLSDSYTETQKKITKESIFTALMKLLEKNQFNEVTITQITNLAGVSRMAFYRNYNVKEDIIIIYLDELFDKFMNEIKNSRFSQKYDVALLYFSYFKERKDFIEVLIKSGLIYIFYDRLSRYLFDFFQSIGGNKLTYSNYLTRYVSGGLYSILIEWINRDTKESVEEMAKLVTEINI